MSKRIFLSIAGFFLSVVAVMSHATTVRFDTSVGVFDVELYDDTRPETVENFLTYVNAMDYDGSIIHRFVDQFIAQGGAFYYNGAFPLDVVTQRDPVMNEPGDSNVRGTISMAKLGGDPNSATSQWFFNLADNSTNLDSQNGGFTVFGEVLGDGMDIVDTLSDTFVIDLNVPSLQRLPLRCYTVLSLNAQVLPGDDHLIFVNSVRVVDVSTDPLPTTQPTPEACPPEPTPTAAPASSGGGASGLVFLFLLSGLFMFRKKSYF